MYGTGRFVLLHDPEEPGAWGGSWRIVLFAQAPLETEIGTDPLLADVTWSWLVDALDSRDAIITWSRAPRPRRSKGFGGLAIEGDGAQIELRASWTWRACSDRTSKHGPNWSECWRGFRPASRASP